MILLRYNITTVFLRNYFFSRLLLALSLFSYATGLDKTTWTRVYACFYN